MGRVACIAFEWRVDPVGGRILLLQQQQQSVSGQANNPVAASDRLSPLFERVSSWRSCPQLLPHLPQMDCSLDNAAASIHNLSHSPIASISLSQCASPGSALSARLSLSSISPSPSLSPAPSVASHSAIDLCSEDEASSPVQSCVFLAQSLRFVTQRRHDFLPSSFSL